jgi:hypothetical protein
MIENAHPHVGCMVTHCPIHPLEPGMFPVVLPRISCDFTLRYKVTAKEIVKAPNFGHVHRELFTEELAIIKTRLQKKKKLRWEL